MKQSPHDQAKGRCTMKPTAFHICGALVAATAVSLIAAAPPTSTSTQPATRPVATQPAHPDPSDILKTLGKDFHALIEDIPGGQVRWTTGEVVATGIGLAGRGRAGAQAAKMAQRAARLVAARNALLALRGVRADATGKPPRLRRGAVTTEGTLRNFTVEYSRYDPKKRIATCRLRAPLFGQHSAVTIRRSRPPAPVKVKRTEIVIIEARGTGFVPALWPRIVTERGRLFRGPRGRYAGPRVVYAWFGPLVRAETPATKADLLKSVAARDASLKVIVLTASPAPKAAPGTLVLSNKDLIAYPRAIDLLKAGRCVVLAAPPQRK